MIAVETAAAATMLAGLARWAMAQQPSRRAHRTCRRAAACVASLGIADLVYNSGLGGLGTYPVHVVGDVGFTAFALGGLAWVGGGLTWRRERPLLAAALVVAALVLWVQHGWVLSGLPLLEGVVPMVSRVNAHLYSAATAALGALCLLLSHRSTGRIDTLAVQSFLLMLISDYSVRYHAFAADFSGPGPAEWGWAAGEVGLATATILAVARGRLPLESPLALAPWRSLRTLLGVLGLAANLIMVGGMLAAGHLRLGNAHALTHLGLFCFLAALASHGLGILVATQLTRVTRAIPVVTTAPVPGGAYRSMQLDALPQRSVFLDLDAVLGGFHALASRCNRLFLRLAQSEAEAATGRLAEEVAHDIRSPLSALSVALRASDGLEEPVRLLYRRGLQRLESIADQLLRAHRGAHHERQPRSAVGHGQQAWLGSTMASIVAEKSWQYRGAPGLRIIAGEDEVPEPAFAAMEGWRLQVVLSNLIDNAVAATGGRGQVVVTACNDAATVGVEIADTGRGMSPAQLAQLGERGRRFATHQGHGLGVATARATLESFGGRLTFTSSPGRGTTARIELPAARPPRWFPTALLFAPGQRVVVVDDDACILSMWQQRLAGLCAGIELHHVGDAAGLQALGLQRDRPSADLFLVDHQLGRGQPTGLDLIERFALERASVLVTAHYEEASIQRRCEALHIPLLPKEAVRCIPIALSDCPPAGHNHFGADGKTPVRPESRKTL